MDDETIVKTALQRLLDCQMPTGEWADRERDAEARFPDIGRGEYSSEDFLRYCRKPNGFRTMICIESLRLYTGSNFRTRSAQALAWFKENLTAGWFLQWLPHSTGDYTDGHPHLGRYQDVRHTAQALQALLRFDPYAGEVLGEGLRGILDKQLPGGMWPRWPGDSEGALLQTVCCVDLLMHVTRPSSRKKKVLKASGGDEAMMEKVPLALDLGCAALSLFATNHDDLWENERHTGTVLQRLGQRLLGNRKYAGTVERAVKRLIELKDKEGWVNSSIVDPKIRNSDDKRVETTLRVCAGLARTSGGLRIWNGELESIHNYLRTNFDGNVLSGSDCCYYMDIFCKDAVEFREQLRAEEYSDYLDDQWPESTGVYGQQHWPVSALCACTCACVRCLIALSEGRASGLANYADATSEQEKELYTHLHVLQRAPSSGAMGELPKLIADYLEGGNDQAFSTGLQNLHSKQQAETSGSVSTRQKVIYELRTALIEFLAAYAAHKTCAS